MTLIYVYNLCLSSCFRTVLGDKFRVNITFDDCHFYIINLCSSSLLLDRTVFLCQLHVIICFVSFAEYLDLADSY